MNNDYTALEKKLEYTFKDATLLHCALTHRSYRFENESTSADNQRLEFLGDAVLGLVAAEYLFNQFDTIQEGILTKLRSSITNSTALAVIARKLDLGNYMLLGHGELKSGGATRDSNLTDCLEAILGAVYLDGGIDCITRIFQTFFIPELESVLQQPEIANPKGLLQEFTQREWQTNPEYVCIHEQGPAHNKEFTYEVYIRKESYGIGTASNKQQAQVAAALQAIEELSETGELQFHENTLVQFSRQINTER